MILEVFVEALKAGNNAVIIHIVIEWVTLEIGIISYMVVLHSLVI